MIDKLTNPDFIIALATLLTALAALGRACQTRREVRDLRRELKK
jgi:hypothetical protein